MLLRSLLFVKGREHSEACTEAYRLGAAESELLKAFEEGSLALVSRRGTAGLLPAA